MKKVYELNNDGIVKREFYYDSLNSYDAMKKHVYYLSLSNGKITEADIYPTVYGHAINVKNTVYWCKG